MSANYTAEELRNMLCGNLEALKDGRMSPVDANSRSSQVREISRIFTLQMRGLTHLGLDYTPEMREFLKGRERSS